MTDNDARFERAVVLAALWAATRGSQNERVRLSVLAAAAGSRQAEAGGSLAALLQEYDGIEGIVLEKLADAAESIASTTIRSAVSDARLIHDCCARMRAAATAGFAHAAASAARKRARAARHDIVNNIGTVRNAILLMDDEPDDAAREHFRAIAKRNSVASEQLVRTHLSDESACNGARAASPGDAEFLIASELTTCADRGIGADAADALRELAALTGVALQRDEASGQFTIAGAGSRRDQRHDVGRARQGDDADTLSL